MNVGQLIEVLQKMDPLLPVVFVDFLKWPWMVRNVSERSISNVNKEVHRVAYLESDEGGF